MARHRVPKSISPDVLDFCRGVVRDPHPVYVEVKAIRDARVNECFYNVLKQVERSGGNVQYGWAIWLWPSVFIEAEFHAVWKDVDGRYLDVSAWEPAAERILFLPDFDTTYTGQQRNNVRKAIADDNDVHDFISVADRIYEVTNRGDRAYKHGPVEIPAGEIVPLLNIKETLHHKLLGRYTKPNSLCPCGSGKKNKHCCRIYM